MATTPASFSADDFHRPLQVKKGSLAPARILQLAGKAAGKKKTGNSLKHRKPRNSGFLFDFGNQAIPGICIRKSIHPIYPVKNRSRRPIQ